MLTLFEYRAGFDMIEGEEYLGATGLHLAIAYGNDEVAEMLILSKYFSNQHCIIFVAINIDDCYISRL